MSSEKEFKVNEYITLKLEEGKTNIYIEGKLFQQCKSLLMNIPNDDISSFDEIESIDNAQELFRYKRLIVTDIPPVTEFWGHCSNLQAWCEHGYDTRLLHRNLGFPLLKRLSEVNDPKAKFTFKEEIAKRFDSGYPNVVNYLIEGEYLNFLDVEVCLSIIESIFYKPTKYVLFYELSSTLLQLDKKKAFYLLLDLFYSIKGNRTISKKFSDLLIGAGKLNEEIIFRYILRLIDSILESGLLEEKIIDLLDVIEVLDGKIFSIYFSRVVIKINDTLRMRSSLGIETKFIALINEIENFEESEDQFSKFFFLIRIIRGTQIYENLHP
ncbi:MAG: hypothetical protein ACW96X_13025, partial [Promethearchaeota archaeon]